MKSNFPKCTYFNILISKLHHRYNIQFNTYTTYTDITHPTDIEEKPQVPTVHTDIAPGVGHFAPPAYLDLQNPTFSDHMQNQLIQTQFFQQMGARPKPTNPFILPHQQQRI